jgi:hypothetical protein
MRRCEQVVVQEGLELRTKVTFTGGDLENLMFGAVIYRECRYMKQL